LTDAYAAFRQAAQTARHVLPSTAQQLGDKLLQDERDKGQDIEKQWDVDELRDRFERARAADPEAYRLWRKAVVRHLLGCTASSVRSMSERPMQALPGQEAAVLAKLVEMGYSPTALSKPKPGCAGAKAAVRASLGKSALFQSDIVFNKAWQRLRNLKLIADG